MKARHLRTYSHLSQYYWIIVDVLVFIIYSKRILYDRSFFFMPFSSNVVKWSHLYDDRIQSVYQTQDSGKEISFDERERGLDATNRDSNLQALVELKSQLAMQSDAIRTKRELLDQEKVKISHQVNEISSPQDRAP